MDVGYSSLHLMWELRCLVCGRPFMGNYRDRKCCSKKCADDRRDSYEKRFWMRVRKGDGCWEWTGRTEKNGYARIRREGSRSRVFVHRLSYEMANGEIPEGMLVCHHCDNKRCVRPDHLFLGTHLDNARDMLSKGRANNVSGEKHGRAKLSERDVRRLKKKYASGSTQRELAEEFEVHPMHVHKIVTGKKWVHLR